MIQWIQWIVQDDSIVFTNEEVKKCGDFILVYKCCLLHLLKQRCLFVIVIF